MLTPHTDPKRSLLDLRVRPRAQFPDELTTVVLHDDDRIGGFVGSGIHRYDDVALVEFRVEPLQKPILVAEDLEEPLQRRLATLLPTGVEMPLPFLALDDLRVVAGGDELGYDVFDRRGPTEDGDGGVIEIMYLRDGVVPRMEAPSYPLRLSGKLKGCDG